MNNLISSEFGIACNYFTTETSYVNPSLWLTLKIATDHVVFDDCNWHIVKAITDAPLRYGSGAVHILRCRNLISGDVFESCYSIAVDLK